MKEEILKLRTQGFTINQIVKKLHCAKSTVSYHINKHNLGGNIESFLFGVSQEIIDMIIKYRHEQKTYSDISLIVDISEDKLMKICRKYKINKPIYPKHKIFNNNEVISFYLSVKSIKLTAKHFNTSKETIRRYIPDELVKQQTNSKNKSLKTKSQSVIEWRKRKKIELVEYKGGKCERCDYHKSLNALTFHHKDPSLKDFTISSKSYSIERLKKEVDKCILLCSNCHIELHEELNMIK
jgi:hypothetical protein